MYIHIYTHLYNTKLTDIHREVHMKKGEKWDAVNGDPVAASIVSDINLPGRHHFVPLEREEVASRHLGRTPDHPRTGGLIHGLTYSLTYIATPRNGIN